MLPVGVGARVEMQREGLDPAREIPIGLHHPQVQSDPHSPQLEDLKRSIQSRFASVSTPSNFIQAGLFNTLGNNPITQLMAAVGGVGGDIWDSLLSDLPDEQKLVKRRQEKGSLTEKLKGATGDGKSKIEAEIKQIDAQIEKLEQKISSSGGGAGASIPVLNKHTKLLDEMLDSLLGIEDTIKAMWHGRGSMHGKGEANDNSKRSSPRSGKFVKKDDDGPPLRDINSYSEPDYRSAEQRQRDQIVAERKQDEKILDALKKDQVGLREEIDKASEEEKIALEAQLKESQAAITELENKLGVPDRTTDDKKIQAEKATRQRTPEKSESVESQSKPYVPNMDAPTAAKSNTFDPDKTINTTVDQLEREATKEIAEKNKSPDDRVVIDPKEAAKMREQALGDDEKEEKSFLSQMFDQIGFKKTSGVMEQFAKTIQKASGELSKSFGDVSKAVVNKSKPLVDAIKGSETTKYLNIGKNALGEKIAPLAKAIKGSETAKFLTRKKDSDDRDIAKDLSSKATGTVASIATGKAMGADNTLQNKVDQAIEGSGVSPDPSMLDSALGVAEDASVLTSLGSGAKKVAGWIGKGIKGTGKFIGSNAGALGKAAAVVGAGTASFNAVSDEMAGKHIDNVGDIVPEGMDKINPFEWISRSARYAGNKINKGYEAISGGSIGTDIYDLLHKDPMNGVNVRPSIEPMQQPSRADAIKTIQDQIDENKSSKTDNADTVIGTVNNNVNKNTTVLPTRTYVQNSDSSFNRYINNSLRY